MNLITTYLSGGDFRMNKKSKALIAKALKDRRYVNPLVAAMAGNDPLIRMRAADVLESISVRRPDLLQRHKQFLLNRATHIDQQEVRWHAAQIIPRLRLTAKENDKAFSLMLAWAKNRNEKSNIVRVFSLQAAFDLAIGKPQHLNKVLPIVRAYSRSSTPSLSSRARKLLDQTARRQLHAG